MEINKILDTEEFNALLPDYFEDVNLRGNL